MQSLIIHMSTSIKRRANAEKLLGTLPDPQLIEAVDGRLVDQVVGVDVRRGDLHPPSYPFAMAAGEVGCFLSHRRCWQHIVDTGAEYMLIAEDDLSLDMSVWPDALALARASATADHYIRLPAKNREPIRNIVGEHGASKLFLPAVIGLQTVCQIVGRNTAKRLLTQTEIIDRPVDTTLQMHWVTGQPVHTILPNGVSEITQDVGGSTIQKKSHAGGKLAREINRMIYRARVRLRPQTR